MCHSMSSSRKTQRWPLCYFYNMLNITFVNAYVIYCFNQSKSGSMKKLARIDFLLELHKQLTVAHQRSRLLNPRIRGELRSIIESILEIQPGTSKVPSSTDSRKHVPTFCSYNLKRKTSVDCSSCQKKKKNWSQKKKKKKKRGGGGGGGWGGGGGGG
uniref:PiggyBac transposable element-derived protein domain-containing protein n=1 Tax=Cacopsylla melanoneura TaxID=428564 RepID=A0A8D9DY47_9HEMI